MIPPSGLRVCNTLVVDLSLIMLILEVFVKECNPFPCPEFAKCDSNSRRTHFKAMSSDITTPESAFSPSALSSFQGLRKADDVAFQFNSSENSVSSLSLPSNLPSLENGPVPGAITVSLPDISLDNGQPVNAKESFGNSDYSNLVLKLDREYTPHEIAEYIYSTGDENGISQIVYEMVQDGQIMSSRDDVIHFLEEVQTHLAKMKEKMGQNQEDPILTPLQQNREGKGRSMLHSGHFPSGLGNTHRNFRRDNTLFGNSIGN